MKRKVAWWIVLALGLFVWGLLEANVHNIITATALFTIVLLICLLKIFRRKAKVTWYGVVSIGILFFLFPTVMFIMGKTVYMWQLGNFGNTFLIWYSVLFNDGLIFGWSSTAFLFLMSAFALLFGIKKIKQLKGIYYANQNHTL